MLVAMTYSIELFICVVIGLCIGHLVFNTKSAVGESVDPCCASQQQGASVLAVNSNNGQIQTSSRTPCEPPEAGSDMDSVHEELCCHSRQQDAEVGAGNVSDSASPPHELVTHVAAQSTSTAAILTICNCCGTPDCQCIPNNGQIKKDRPPPYPGT